MLKLVRRCIGNGEHRQAPNSSPIFRTLQLYSTSSPKINPCFGNYLVESLGFSHQQSLSTSSKLAQFWRIRGNERVSDFSFADNANSVINFFKQHGFKDAHIKQAVISHPRILSCNVEKNLKPKFECLKQLGFSGCDLFRIVLSNQRLLNSRLDPAVQALRAVLGSDENVVRVLKKSHWLSLSSVSKYMVNNVAILENEYGMDGDVVRRHVLQLPKAFVVETGLFRSRLIRVEEHWGISRDSWNFMSGIYLLSSTKEEYIEAKCDVFKSYGWSQYDILTLVRQCPWCLGLSESTIKKKLEFLMMELGYQPAGLVSHSGMLTYSLERRVLPRHRVLMVLEEKGLVDDQCFYTAVCLSDAKFLKKFVQPYKDVVPDLNDLYLKGKDCSEDDRASETELKSHV